MSINIKVTGGDIAGQAEQALRGASEAVMRELFAAMQQSFTAKAWDWPQDLPTRKLKGATLAEKIRSYEAGDGVRAGNPRNLIDVGNLRQTGYYELTGPYSARFTWSAQYATAVHEGARIRAWGNPRAIRTLPPRPWTAAVLGRVQVPGIKPFPLEKRLKDVWLARLKAGQ